MVAQLIAVFFHIAFMELLVINLGLGLFGIALASTFSAIIMLVITVMFALSKTHISEAIFWPDATIWAGWREYFSLAIPAAGIFCAEYWAYQILIILSLYLGVDAQVNMIIAV